jgi:ubiquitin C-terminal hydrolase
VLQPDGGWLHFNDHQVDVVPASQVLAEKVYLLFYQKVAA